MSLAEATAALEGFIATPTRVQPDDILKAEFRRTVAWLSSWFRGAVTAYFVESENLFCSSSTPSLGLR
jgi:hypothetical protein